MKWGIISGRLFLVLVSTIVGFLLFDYVSTWFISSRSPIEQRYPVQYVRHPQPYTMFGGKANGLGLNTLGYRGQVPAVPKAPDEFRIFILGGSTVFNGAPPIAELLQNEFSRTGTTHVKVYNFGVVSSVTGMELARIVFIIPELQPDLVIFYNGNNDIFHPWRWDPRPGFPFNFVAYESNPLLESDVKEYPAIAMLAYGSNIARWCCPQYFVNKFTRLDELRNDSKWKTEEWKEQIADSYVGNVVKADIITRAFGA